MRDPYLYPDSEVLKNLAGIQDEQMLKDMEADYTLYRLSEIVTDADWMKFDFDSLCKMHYHIFQDIYEWAGCPVSSILKRQRRYWESCQLNIRIVMT